MNLVITFITELRLFVARLNKSSNSAFVRDELSKEAFASLITVFASSTTFLSSSEVNPLALKTAFDNSSVTFFNSSEFIDFSTDFSFELSTSCFDISILLSSFTSALIDFKIAT